MGDAVLAAGGRTWLQALLTQADHPELSKTVTQLVDAARCGDADAIGGLYRMYVDRTYRYAFWNVQNHHLAEDLTSEAWVGIVRGLPGFRWQGKEFTAWMMTVVKNVIRDHHRARNRQPRLVSLEDSVRAQTLPDRGPGPEEAALLTDQNRMLGDALGAVSTVHRQVLVMRFILDMSVAETAAVLGRTTGATKILTLRALQAVSRALPAGELRCAAAPAV